MKSRVWIVIIALVLAGVAAVFSASYLRDARTQIAAEGQPIEVLVAQEDIPQGVSADEMVANKMVVLQEVPKRFTAAGAVSTAKAIDGMVLSTPLTRGQQVTGDQFSAPDVAGLAFSIPKQQLALTIPVDEVTGVGGLVKPGDHVVLYATFSPGPKGEKDFTKMLLADAKVLAVGASLRSEQTAANDDSKGGSVMSSSRNENEQAQAAKTLTVAVAPADVERVVFAEETARVWCALLPATTSDLPNSRGQSIRTVVR